MTLPAYTHDCDRCRHLGTFTGASDKDVDAYVCPRFPSEKEHALILRMSSSGPDYGSYTPSWLGAILDSDPPNKQPDLAVLAALYMVWVAGGSKPKPRAETRRAKA